MTEFNPTKRRLFTRILDQNSDFLRPPWAIDEYDFVSVCKECSACRDACPEQIITFDSHHQPIISFQGKECTFCGDCVSVCPSGALVKLEADSEPWNAKVVLNSGCLGEEKIHCRSCGDICEHQAIFFPLAAQGITSPKIDLEKCTGCGACVAMCPTQALKVSYQN